MTDGYLILRSIIHAAQSCQSNLLRFLDTASSTELIGVLASQLETFDLIESEALQLALRRGWEITNPSLPPLERCKSRFPYLHRAGKSDSKIAEALIYYHTAHIIKELKLSHRCRTDDTQIHELFQKLLFCQSSNIRQMQPFL